MQVYPGPRVRVRGSLQGFRSVCVSLYGPRGIDTVAVPSDVLRMSGRQGVPVQSGQLETYQCHSLSPLSLSSHSMLCVVQDEQ